MVIERPLSGYNPWDETQHRRLSRGSLITIGLVAAVHVVGALYLYQIKTAPPKPVADPGGIVIQPITLPKDAPKRMPAKLPPKVVIVHDARPSTIKAPVIIDFPPQKPQVQQDNSLPPSLADKPLAPDLSGLTTPKPPQPKVIHDPTWLARPTNQQLVEFYPPRALDDEIAGQAILDCLVTASGQLTRCTVSGETPRGQGFAEAALKAARVFRMSPKTEDGQPVEGGLVHVPMRFAVQ